MTIAAKRTPKTRCSFRAKQVVSPSKGGQSNSQFIRGTQAEDGSALGWYGPLIDLSRSSSHIGDFVQLLLFVHRSTPLQCKSSKGRYLIKTDIQVGDDRRRYFELSVWQKSMGSIISVGDVILLKNVKIVKFGDIVEARNVQWSSLLCSIHPYELLISKDIEEVVAGCRVGITIKDKLRKVIKWAQQSRPNICNTTSYHETGHLPKNWKVLEERIPTDCVSLSEVSQLTSSCNAVVSAFIGEIFLQASTTDLGDTEKEKIFLSRRVYKTGDNNLVEDLMHWLSATWFAHGYRNVIPLTDLFEKLKSPSCSMFDIRLSCYICRMNQITCRSSSRTEPWKSCLGTSRLNKFIQVIDNKCLIKILN